MSLLDIGNPLRRMFVGRAEVVGRRTNEAFAGAFKTGEKEAEKSIYTLNTEIDTFHLFVWRFRLV